MSTAAFDTPSATASAWPLQWQAHWIWFEKPAAAAPRVLQPRGLPPAESWERFCYLRQGLDLAAVPATVPARVSADSRFVLFINGAEVARGPARSVPERLPWVELDLAPYLRPGRNAVAALVRFYGRPTPWWMPAQPSFQLGFGCFVFEAPAIALFSGHGWKSRQAPYTAFAGEHGSHQIMMPPAEIIDGRDIPRGWNEAEFDDSDWEGASVLVAARVSGIFDGVPSEPYSLPEPEGIAQRTALPVELKPLHSLTIARAEAGDPVTAYGGGATVAGAGDPLQVFDAGGITIATPRLRVRGAAGAIVDVYASEELTRGGAPMAAPRYYALRYLLAGNGIEEFEGFDPTGFRYLGVATRGDVEVLHAGAVERRYPGDSAEGAAPLQGGAFFDCDDARLNAIWLAGKRTLEVCATDSFIDCPGREQRAWIGDAYVHSLLTYATCSDWRLVRRNLRLGAHVQRRDGLLSMTGPGDLALVPLTIPDWSLHWVRTLARYWEHSGDRATVAELLPVALLVLAAVERFRAADGLLRGVTGWVFVDWAMTERSDVVGALDALYAAALGDLAELADAIEMPAEAGRLRRRAELTRQAFQLLWDERRGVYVDAADGWGPRRRVSQQTNAMAIVGGCAPRERWGRMLDYILDERRLVLSRPELAMGRAPAGQGGDPARYGPFEPEENVIAAQPFYAHFLHDAVARAGRRELLAGLCLKWWPQLEHGNTTIEEFWDGPSGLVSRAHAWAATPTHDLTAHVLGVRPLSPGCSRVSIRPFFGTLHRLAGRVPVPEGLIELELTRGGGSISLPQGVHAVVEFADAPLAGCELGPGRHELRSTAH